jgi:hypothetical protein
VAPGEGAPVTLVWDRVSDTPINWTVFVQMVDKDGEIVAQADGPPLDGYYPTSLWREPCQVTDVHLLTVPSTAPPGDYEIIVGLYDANDTAYSRAQPIGQDGTVLPEYAVPLGIIRVVRP